MWRTGSAVLLPPELLDDRGQARSGEPHFTSQQVAAAAAAVLTLMPRLSELPSGRVLQRSGRGTAGTRCRKLAAGYKDAFTNRPAHGTWVDGEVVPATEHQSWKLRRGHTQGDAPLAVACTKWQHRASFTHTVQNETVRTVQPVAGNCWSFDLGGAR
ncbi:hypothetical protein CCMA1212_009032 [Trichoderma ghanense]|uniref:Uncharacterized protein n=1 Tax=Trichoderma ghanense TaxID=65468 RepID=A0ABY2GWH2_9HYPO